MYTQFILTLAFLRQSQVLIFIVYFFRSRVLFRFSIVRTTLQQNYSLSPTFLSFLLFRFIDDDREVYKICCMSNANHKSQSKRSKKNKFVLAHSRRHNRRRRTEYIQINQSNQRAMMTELRSHWAQVVIKKPIFTFHHQLTRCSILCLIAVVSFL